MMHIGQPKGSFCVIKEWKRTWWQFGFWTKLKRRTPTRMLAHSNARGLFRWTKHLSFRLISNTSPFFQGFRMKKIQVWKLFKKKNCTSLLISRIVLRDQMESGVFLRMFDWSNGKATVHRKDLSARGLNERVEILILTWTATSKSVFWGKKFPLNWADAAVARFLLPFLIKSSRVVLLLTHYGSGRTFRVPTRSFL